jgi:hypothetical protein
MQRDYLAVSKDSERRRPVSSEISALDLVSAINSPASSISGGVSPTERSPPQQVATVPALQRQKAIRGGQRPRASTKTMPPLRTPRLDPSGIGRFVGRRVPVNSNRGEVFNLKESSNSAISRSRTANSVGSMDVQVPTTVMERKQRPQPPEQRRRSSFSQLVGFVNKAIPRSLNFRNKRPTFEDYRREVEENEKVVAERRKVDGVTGCIRPNRDVYHPNDIKQKRRVPTHETPPLSLPKDPGYIPRRPVPVPTPGPEQNVGLPQSTLRRQRGRVQLRSRSLDTDAKHGYQVGFAG